MFGLGKLLYVVVLTINGIAVLSEDRFLNRIGWGSKANINNPNMQFNQFSTGDMMMNNNNNDGSIKVKLINLISAIRTLMRIPLIAINILIILYELILG